MTDRPQKPDRPPVVVPVLGLTVLVFLLGSAVTQFRVFPYPHFLEPAWVALEAQIERTFLTVADPEQLGGQIYWRRARTEVRGVTRYDEARSAPGYTLYTSTHESGAHLVNARGEVVYEWSASFGEVWPDPPHVENPVPDDDVRWDKAIAFPDGAVLAGFTARGDTPYGYGLVKLDRDSNVLWRFSEAAHHDVQVEPGGTILALVHRFRGTRQGSLEGLPLSSRILTDEVVRLSPEGEVLDRVDLVDAFASSAFRWVLQSNYLSTEGLVGWDMLHANAVRAVSAAFARRHDFAEAGMIMVSLRSPSLLALVDPAAGRVVWMQRSFWRFQHDPHPLDDGHVLLFDNEGHRGAGGRSRVVEFDPATGALAWSYAGTPEDPLYSEFSSHVQALPNGNVLIVESNAGRLVEVTRAGEIVWEFWNPARLVEDGVEYVASIGDARRYAADELPFLEAVVTVDGRSGAGPTGPVGRRGGSG